jgi:aryl-alcohol dehydrogenase-like predicted oxidoreductase
MDVSRFCVGAMTFGSKLEQADAQRVVDEALDNGVNFIDTADSYGRSEEILGQILPPEKRNRVFLATKVFRRYCRDEHVGRNSRVNIINSLERSLRLLNTDYVDLYQLHHPDPVTPLEETLQTLDTLIKAGKIRYIGVSNHYAWQMATMLGESKVHGWEPIVSLQANYDILDRQIELETVPFLEKLNIALMCYGPLCGGILTGKYRGGEDIPEGSRAEQNRKLQEYLKDNVVEEVLGGLVDLTESTEFSMNQLAILWLLSKPHASSIILGGSKPDHFSQLYEIADAFLPQDLVERIDALSEPRVYSVYRNQPVTAGAPLGVQW